MNAGYALHMRRQSPFLALIAGSLAGCGAQPPVVQSAGYLPKDAGYAFAEEAPPPPAIAPVLAEALKRQGLAASDDPKYLVQAEYSRPPARTGTVEADQTAPEWRRAPARRGKTISHLSIWITEIATGGQVYRVTASQPTRAKIDDAALLAQAAFTPQASLPPPAQ